MKQFFETIQVQFPLVYSAVKTRIIHIHIAVQTTFVYELA